MYFLLFFYISVLKVDVNQFKILFPGKMIYRDYIVKTKHFQSLDINFDEMFATNRHLFQSMWSLSQTDKVTHHLMTKHKKYFKDNINDDIEKKTTSCSREESFPENILQNIGRCEAIKSSSRQDWLVHLLLGNLPRQGGISKIGAKNCRQVCQKKKLNFLLN